MKLWTKEQVAEFIGLSPDTVRKMAEKKTLPHYKLGHKCLRFDEQEIKEWVRQRKIICRPLSLSRLRAVK